MYRDIFQTIFWNVLLMYMQYTFLPNTEMPSEIIYCCQLVKFLAINVFLVTLFEQKFTINNQNTCVLKVKLFITPQKHASKIPHYIRILKN